MALRGKIPVVEDRKLKAMFYGRGGTWKTSTALHFPKPYIIDTELGTVQKFHVELIQQQQGAVFKSRDFDEVLGEVRELCRGGHEYKTLIIDSLTPLYSNLIRTARDKKCGIGKEYETARMQMERIIDYLMSMDMNIILIARLKPAYSPQNEDEKFIADAQRGLEYDVDLALYPYRKTAYQTADAPMAYVTKSRMEEFKGEIKFTYDVISKLYGRDILERPMNAVKCASDEDIDLLKSILYDQKVPQSTINIVLDKGRVSYIHDLSTEQVQKWTTQLQQKGKENAVKSNSDS